jgi:uncharacterized protein YigA (DUF484 family)
LIPSLRDIKIIDPITVGILMAEVHSKVLRDKVKASKELKVLMKEYPDNVEAYMKYWTLMKELNNIKELEDVSNRIQIVSTLLIAFRPLVLIVFKNLNNL